MTTATTFPAKMALVHARRQLITEKISYSYSRTRLILKNFKVYIFAKNAQYNDGAYHVFPPKWRWFMHVHY